MSCPNWRKGGAPLDAESAHLIKEVQHRLLAGGFSPTDGEWIAQRKWWDVIARATIGENYWECFERLAPLMSDAEYAATARELWVAHRGPPDPAAILLRHGRAITQEMWMRSDDATTYRALPEIVTIYRGSQKGSENGWSWTLRKRMADHFAFGLGPLEGGTSVILSGRVRKDDIFAIFSGDMWMEHEVVVPPEKVEIVASEGDARTIQFDSDEPFD